MKNKVLYISIAIIAALGLLVTVKSKKTPEVKKMQYGNGQTIDVQDFEHLDYGNEVSEWSVDLNTVKGGFILS